MNNYHATAVVINDHAVLLMGEAGIGKSDLALRLMARGAQLLADDQVLVEVSGDELIAHAPKAAAGRLEVRGVGITKHSFKEMAVIKTIITLVKASDEERLPEIQPIEIEGVFIKNWRLSREAPSLVEKVLLVMGNFSGQDIFSMEGQSKHE